MPLLFGCISEQCREDCCCCNKEKDCRYLLIMNSDEYVRRFLIRLKEELQLERRTASNTSPQTPSK